MGVSENPWPARPEASLLTHDLGILTMDLGLWYRTTQLPESGADFRTATRGEGAFLVAQRSLEVNVIEALEKAQKFALLPLLPAYAWRLGHVVEQVHLPAGQPLDLVQVRDRRALEEDMAKVNDHFPTNQLHFGDGRFEMSTKSIARAISDGARISVIDQRTGEEIEGYTLDEALSLGGGG